MVNQLFENMGRFLQQFSLRQRIVIIVTAIGIISSTIALLMWANRPEYALLYSNLEPEAASAIVSDLRSSGMKYRLENSGRTIYVPQESVTEMRLKFVQEGYLKDGVSGYELFEQTGMGMTTFMQRVNMQRALEGELTRTINQFPEVSQSRVHLVISENRLFEKDRKGSASVVLYLRPGASLNEQQVSGIAALVANSVKDIAPEDVVVLDSKGNILLDGRKRQGAVGNVGSQWELRSNVESELQRKVLGIVEGVVGKNNSVVKVSVEMNFDRVERTVEEIDPDKVAVLSEETYTENSAENGEDNNFQAEKVTSNYEISKKSERYVSGAGSIRRLAVAVLVNGKYKGPQEGEDNENGQYIPRSAEELEKIKALVKTAVGFSEDRGDILEVQNIEFDAGLLLTNQQYLNDMKRWEILEKVITYGILAISLLIGFIFLRKFLSTSMTQFALKKGEAETGEKALPAGEAGAIGSGEIPAAALSEDKNSNAMSGAIAIRGEEEIPEDVYIKQLSPEARAKLKAKDKMTAEVVKFAKESPESASKLLRVWMMGYEDD